VLFWVIAAAAWLAGVALTCALLTAAKQTDPALETGGVAASVEIAAAAVPYIGWLLNNTDDEVIVAAREPWPIGRVVAVAVGGAAAPLLGRDLSVDDVLAARAALSGRLETRRGAVAAPLVRADETVGAIALAVRADSGLPVEQTKRLLCAAEAINRRLDPVVPALARRG
jgi:hypothetical protein